MRWASTFNSFIKCTGNSHVEDRNQPNPVLVHFVGSIEESVSTVTGPRSSTECVSFLEQFETNRGSDIAIDTRYEDYLPIAWWHRHRRISESGGGLKGEWRLRLQNPTSLACPLKLYSELRKCRQM